MDGKCNRESGLQQVWNEKHPSKPKWSGTAARGSPPSKTTLLVGVQGFDLR